MYHKIKAGKISRLFFIKIKNDVSLILNNASLVVMEH